MSVRYRKIESRMWTDAAFRELSAAPPNAQTLWLYLLTSPFTVSIPGVIVASDVAMAAALGWTLEGFRKAFLEVEEKGLAKADWDAGVVVLEKALIESDGTARNTNKPGNPNVLKSWADTFDEVPDCELKSLILSRIESLSQSLSKGFGKAFEEAFRKALAKDGRKAFAKALGKALPKAFAQEQEQEQEDQREPPAQPSLVLTGSEPKADRVADLWAEQERLRAESLPGCRSLSLTKDRRKLVQAALRAGYSEDDLRASLAAYAAEAHRSGSLEWFNGETNWRPANIARTLGRLDGNAPTRRRGEQVY